MTPQAYVYAGEWVADCPRLDCYSTEFLFNPVDASRPASLANPRIARKPMFNCVNCGLVFPVDWPPQELQDEIMHILVQRPVPQTRHWYPKDHPVAVAHRIPHGQSPDDLRQENHDHGVAVG
jgi:hypothetical protein